MLGRAVCNDCESGLLFASRLQFLAGPFAMSLSPEAFLFAMIVGREVSLFASPRVPVRKPLHLLPTLAPDCYNARAWNRTSRFIWSRRLRAYRLPRANLSTAVIRDLQKNKIPYIVEPLTGTSSQVLSTAERFL